MKTSLLIFMLMLLSGCDVPPVSCECEMAEVKEERGEPDSVSEHQQRIQTVTTWHYYWQKAEYTFILSPTECRVEYLVRTSPGF